MKKEEMIAQIIQDWKALNLECVKQEETDLALSQELLNASWSLGEKKISYENAVLLDETSETVWFWEMSKEISSGLSFGSSQEISIQTGQTISRKVKTVEYGPEGKAFEYTLDLGAISKAVKQAAKAAGWKFKVVINKQKAIYPPEYRTNNMEKTPMQTFSVTSSDSLRYCRRCGSSLKKDFLFCNQCGLPLSNS